MDIAVQGIVEHLDETWSLVLESLHGIDDALFQWSAGPEYNSTAILLRHLAGSERWWIGECIGGVPAHRNRDAEFVHDTPSRAGVLASVEAARALTHRVLANASVQDLQEPTTLISKRDGARRSKMWALLHYYEHLGYHRGQILLILKMSRQALARR